MEGLGDGKEMKYIIHMSDLHLGLAETDARFDRLCRGLLNTNWIEPEETVIVITGDLMDDAFSDAGYRTAREYIELLKRGGFDVLMIPGNHDYGNGIKLEKKFVGLFKEAFYGRKRVYPLLDIIDGIAFIGLDSMAEELNWYDRLWSEGELGNLQLRRLEHLLRSDEVLECEKRVIYLHHHPIDWQPLHRLRDSHKLYRIIRRAISDGITVDALLYGHYHRGERRNGAWGVPRCYDAGTATMKPRSALISALPWFRVTRSSTRLISLSDHPSKDKLIVL